MKKIIILTAVLLACSAVSADWQYTEDTDAMTSKRSIQASLESNNSLNLGFPYGGKNNGYLHVRQHPKYGLDVILNVDKGQILCNNYQGCDIMVRFDDKPPMRFAGTEPADNSSDTVFVQGAKRFIAEASKARRILVQVTMYKNGAPTLEFFSSKPLDWKPKK